MGHRPISRLLKKSPKLGLFGYLLNTADHSALLFVANLAVRYCLPKEGARTGIDAIIPDKPKKSPKRKLEALLKIIGSGGWIRTNDLRVMSPTSYQTAPPRTDCG